jgi:hypothetical protein
MGGLTPGATLIYERVGDTVYARESGSDPKTRIEVGYDYKNYDPRTPNGRPLHDQIIEDKLWGEIRREATDNPALQAALERAILIYHLSKDKPNE